LGRHGLPRPLDPGERLDRTRPDGSDAPDEVVQTDNGAEFQGGFHWHLLDRGIGHSYIKPKTPRLNGKVERSHRIDDEEFCRLLDGVVIDDPQVFNQKLQEWEDFYNFNRPHGGLNGQTPYDRPRQKTTKASA
jgi:transposase InsO family protein